MENGNYRNMQRQNNWGGAGGNGYNASPKHDLNDYRNFILESENNDYK